MVTAWQDPCSSTAVGPGWKGLVIGIGAQLHPSLLSVCPLAWHIIPCLPIAKGAGSIQPHHGPRTRHQSQLFLSQAPMLSSRETRNLIFKHFHLCCVFFSLSSPSIACNFFVDPRPWWFYSPEHICFFPDRSPQNPFCNVTLGYWESVLKWVEGFSFREWTAGDD